MLGVSYKTAWFMCHRIREAMNPVHTDKMGGPDTIVEADETYWGNLYKARAGAGHKNESRLTGRERIWSKAFFPCANVTSDTVEAVLKSQVHPETHLMTDELGVYKRVGKHFSAHSTVNHGKKEYARGNVTSNTVEASFSIFKRGLNGTFHSVFERNLQRNATKFDFKWNYRSANGFNDIERADAALKAIGGKRLTYRRLDGQQTANA